MSGGSFDYNCYRIDDFAGSLREKIDRNNIPDDWGHSYDMPPETVALLEKCHTVIDLAGKLAHHVEWLYSGDHGPESFANLAEKDFAESTVIVKEGE